MTEQFLNELSQAIIDGKKDQALTLTKKLLADGLPPKDILDKGLLAGMDIVGVRFRNNIIFVPQVLISARAMKSSLAILEPLLSKTDMKRKGTIVIGTVKGDIHDIGKNIVSMMLRSNGFAVIDLGINIQVEKFIETVKNEQADLVGMSALLTTTMGYMKKVIDKIKEESLPVKVIIGGAPVSKAFANQIKADGYASNATDAVKLAASLMNKLPNGVSK